MAESENIRSIRHTGSSVDAVVTPRTLDRLLRRRRPDLCESHWIRLNRWRSTFWRALASVDSGFSHRCLPQLQFPHLLERKARQAPASFLPPPPALSIRVQ